MERGVGVAKAEHQWRRVAMTVVKAAAATEAAMAAATDAAAMAAANMAGRGGGGA